MVLVYVTVTRSFEFTYHYCNTTAPKCTQVRQPFFYILHIGIISDQNIIHLHMKIPNNLTVPVVKANIDQPKETVVMAFAFPLLYEFTDV